MIPNQFEYRSAKEPSVRGRYVIHHQIEQFLQKVPRDHRVQTVGQSVKKRSIKSLELGTGAKRILMWSQMHGNESTTTKAVLDLINFLNSDFPGAKSLLESCTIAIIPMLNPDGAEAYTRVNANEIDLNRDARQRTQPESTALRDVFDDFGPDYGFNLHDQRTLFSVGHTPKPATISFLAPAHDEERSVSPSRLKSIQLIIAMNEVLQKYIPGQIGRYNDAFNPDCVGDTFQMTGTPTLLFEAGHYPEDYEREHTREYLFYALLTALQKIEEDKVDAFDEADYFRIPENKKLFFDILIKNGHIIDPSVKKEDAIGIRYVEKLRDGTIHFEPKFEKSGGLGEYFGHKMYDCGIAQDLEALKQRPGLSELLPHF